MSLKPGRAAALLVHFSAFDFGNAEHSSEPKLVPEWMGDVPLYKCVTVMTIGIGLSLCGGSTNTI